MRKIRERIIAQFSGQWVQWCWKRARVSGELCIGIRALPDTRPLPRQAPQRNPDENENEHSKPTTLDSIYGNNPLSWRLFVRLRPAKMKMDMHDVHK